MPAQSDCKTGGGKTDGRLVGCEAITQVQACPHHALHCRMTEPCRAHTTSPLPCSAVGTEYTEQALLSTGGEGSRGGVRVKG